VQYFVHIFATGALMIKIGSTLHILAFTHTCGTMMRQQYRLLKNRWCMWRPTSYHPTWRQKITMNVPFFSLKRQWENQRSALQAALQPVMEEQHYIGGPTVEKFERSFSAYVGVNHTIACNSGTDALWMALHVLNVRPGTIVLTTPFSFIASSSEIVALGAHPVFIDIDPVTYNISPTRMQEWLENNVIMRSGRAIHRTTGFEVAGMVVVNLFGAMADFPALRAIANAWNLWVVEDAAQSAGSAREGKRSGTWGDIATFSFYPTKNLGAMGDAGALTTNNDELAERLFRLRNHGRARHYEYQEYGINSRMDGMQAAILATRLTLLDQLNEARRAHADRYRALLGDVAAIRLPTDGPGYHTYHQFSIALTDTTIPSARDYMVEFLATRGIQTRIFYPTPLSEIPFLATHWQLATPCPEAVRAAQSICALPIWPELTNDEIDYVASMVREAVTPRTTRHTASGAVSL
jgi:dTDP-4-amino-4,6-dideoxygalactose transaminase